MTRPDKVNNDAGFRCEIRVGKCRSLSVAVGGPWLIINAVHPAVMGHEPIDGGEVDARLPLRRGNGCIASHRRMDVHRNLRHKGEDMTRATNSPVMAGLVPAIH